MVSLFFLITAGLLTVSFANGVESASDAACGKGEIRDIVTVSAISATPLEASGILFTGDTNRYLVVSDETDRKEPLIFGMGASGKITERFAVSGVSEINDLESICGDVNGRVYLLTSQSRNKKGNLPDSRTLFIEVVKTDKGYRAVTSIYLWKTLTDAAQADTGAWALFVKKANASGEQDIEGMCIKGDTLLLGFKNPKINNSAVILAIAAPRELLDNRRLDPARVSIWKTLTLFEKDAGIFCGISDMCIAGRYLVGTATGESGRFGVSEDTGLLWFYDIKTGTTTLCKSFRGLKPEGITFNTVHQYFRIVFDNGSKNTSYFMNIKVPL